MLHFQEHARPQEAVHGGAERARGELARQAGERFTEPPGEERQTTDTAEIDGNDPPVV